MSAVLLVAGTRHNARFLAEVVGQFEEQGAQVTLVSGPAIGTGLPGSISVRILDEVSEGSPPAFWRRTALAVPPRRFWAMVERDAWTRQRAAEADVMVALDARAIFAVWRLAQANDRAAAVSGVHAGLRALAVAGAGPGAAAGPGRSARSADDGSTSDRPGAGAAPGEQSGEQPDEPAPALSARLARTARMARAKAGRLKRRLVAVRGGAQPAPAPEVRTRDAVRRTLELVEQGRPDEAEQVAESLVPTLDRAVDRADLLGSLAYAELARAQLPGLLLPAVAAELEHADSLLVQGQHRPALASFLTAARLAFLPGLHFDSLRSPLAGAPDAYAAVLAESRVLQSLAPARGRRHPAAGVPAGRPPRVAIISSGNVNFTRDLSARLESVSGAEIRSLGRSDVAFAMGYHSVLLSLLAGDGRAEELAQAHLGPIFEWADVVLVEWCTRTAVLATLVDPGTTRVVLRLHSFEAWTLAPHLVDFSRVDEVVFVSEHLRELTQRVVPALRADAAPRISVAQNVVDLGGFDRPKEEGARFTLALVGLSSIAKDVRWALEVLRGLRRHDDRYRLLLIGSDLEPTGSATSRAYVEGYRDDLAELEPLGAVERRGHTDDVAEVLREVGVILSSSVRESAHLAVVEGAASGAVPIVRDWPFFAGQEHGARTYYPADWVVEDVDAAVERVLAVTSEAARWGEESAAARTTAMQWDVKVTGPVFEAALFGP